MCALDGNRLMGEFCPNCGTGILAEGMRGGHGGEGVGLGVNVCYGSCSYVSVILWGVE